MSEYAPPLSAQQFTENFAPLHPLMNDTQAYYESARCLFCYDAPCIQACPTGIDIPLFIRQIHTDNVNGAAKTIYTANYLGYACGKVCPTEVLCEGACVYNHQDVKPIEIGRLQSYATDKALRSEKQLFRLAPDNGKKVAIIGAGPAGISCACELRMLGYTVDVFEAKALPSGLTVHGVAPYKITNEEVLAEMDWLQQQFGFTIHYQRPIADKTALRQLEAEYGAIFLGIGLGETRSIQLPGENLVHSLGAIEFIEELRSQQHTVSVPERVIVLGGGNTAMDAASECARMGAKSTILAYRRDKASMGAYTFEYELAKGAGVQGLFNVNPVEILGTTQVEGVRFVRTQVVDGKLENVPDSEFVLPCDWVIRATGQSKQTGFLQQIPQLGFDRQGRITVDPHTHQTTHPQYFAGGDAVNGGAEVVNAAAEGKLAAQGIHRYLAG